jgi:hypothetical protein
MSLADYLPQHRADRKLSPSCNILFEEKWVTLSGIAPGWKPFTRRHLPFLFATQRHGGHTPHKPGSAGAISVVDGRSLNLCPSSNPFFDISNRE